MTTIQENPIVLERLARLEKIANLFHLLITNELNDLRTLLSASGQVSETPPHSAASTSAADIANILASLGTPAKPVEPPKEIPAPPPPAPEELPPPPAPAAPMEIRFEHLPPLVQRQVTALKRILMRHLSPKVYEIGRGFLDANNVLSQYEEDAMVFSPERLLGWPAGFYRNRASKETQFLLPFMGNKAVLVIDRLPGSSALPKVWIQETASGNWVDLITCGFDSEETLLNVYGNVLNEINARLMHFSELVDTTQGVVDHSSHV